VTRHLIVVLEMAGTALVACKESFDTDMSEDIRKNVESDLDLGSGNIHRMMDQIEGPLDQMPLEMGATQHPLELGVDKVLAANCKESFDKGKSEDTRKQDCRESVLVLNSRNDHLA